MDEAYTDVISALEDMTLWCETSTPYSGPDVKATLGRAIRAMQYQRAEIHELRSLVANFIRAGQLKQEKEPCTGSCKH